MATADLDVTYAEFFVNAPAMNPMANLITGSVCWGQSSGDQRSTDEEDPAVGQAGG